MFEAAFKWILYFQSLDDTPLYLNSERWQAFFEKLILVYIIFDKWRKWGGHIDYKNASQCAYKFTFLMDSLESISNIPFLQGGTHLMKCALN